MKIYLHKKEFEMNSKPLLKTVLSRKFGKLECIMDSIIKYIPSAKENNAKKLELHYGGDLDSDICNKYKKCSGKEPLLINIVKLYHQFDYSSFDAFGRILSGTLCKNETVKVLGENYNPIRDDENMFINEVTGLNIYQSRYKISTDKACAGQWVLISGIDQIINRSATVVDLSDDIPIETVYPMLPIQFRTEAVMKIACESCIPSEHPKMQEGLKKVSKSYPLAEVKVEESGEHLVIGTGELYLD